MLRAEDPLADGQQRGELVAGPGRVPRLPGPAGEVGAGGQGIRVLRAEDPLAHGQQRGELVPGRGRVPRLPGPAGQAGAGDQGVRVLAGPGPARGRAAARRTGRGPRPVARLPGPAGEVVPGGQGVRVLGPEDPSPVRQATSAGRSRAAGVAAAVARGSARSAPCRRCQRREPPGRAAAAPRIPARSLAASVSSGIAASIRAAAACRHCAGQLGWHLVGGDGLDQPVHRHRPVGGRGDQRIPAQRRDRITGRQRVLQQRRQHRRHLLAEPPGQARAGLQQQPQRDRLGRAERQQPQQPGRARRGLLQVLKRQPPGGGHRLGVPGRLAAAQQVRAPLPEQGQVPGQAVPGGLDVGGGLLQRQRQPAQLTGQVQGRPPVRVAGPADQELRGHLRVEHRHVQGLAGRPDLVPAGDQHPPGPGRGHERRHRGPVRRVVEHQQPRRRAGGQHRVHRGHRVPADRRRRAGRPARRTRPPAPPGPRRRTARPPRPRPSWRWAYSSATLVLPAPPSPDKATTRGPASSSPASRASSSASSSSRPARNTGRGASRSAGPPLPATGPVSGGRLPSLSSSPWIPVLSPWIKPC